MKGATFEIVVCRGPQCAGKRDADAVHEALVALVAEHGLGDRVTLARKVCFGRCTMGPNVHVRTVARPDDTPAPRSALYNHVTVADARAVVEEHVMAGVFLGRLVAAPPAPAAQGADPRLAAAVLPPPPDVKPDRD